MCAYQDRTLGAAHSVTGRLMHCDMRSCFVIDLRVAPSLSHAMLVDQNNESVVVPLNAELASEGKLELANSRLMSSHHPNTT